MSTALDGTHMVLTPYLQSDAVGTRCSSVGRAFALAHTRSGFDLLYCVSHVLMAHAYNPSPQEGEAGGSDIKGHPFYISTLNPEGKLKESSVIL